MVAMAFYGTLREHPVVIKLVKRGVEARIVAGCARKTDASHWARLFAACGDPLELLDACLEAGDVNCAAALLLPVRHVCGTKVCEHMVDKVRAAAERQRARERRDLIKQLDAFGARLRLEGDSDE
jgi:hypothetical protein